LFNLVPQPEDLVKTWEAFCRQKAITVRRRSETAGSRLLTPYSGTP
jgi:hypothetical protein